MFESLHKAVEHHRGGRLDEAEELYRQILAVEPDNVHALHLSGVVAHQRRDYPLALERIARAIALDGRQISFHTNLASVHLAMGNIEPAIACLREAIRLDPNHVKARNGLGMVLAGARRWDEAAACLREVLRIRPDFGPAHNNLGKILNQQGRVAEAIECFRDALGVKPDLMQAHDNLASALKDQGRLEEAIGHYRQALGIDPKYAEGHYNLAIALKDAQKPDEAIAAYREALRVRPDFVEARFNLGNLLRSQQLLSEAQETYEIVIRQRPEFAEAHLQLGGVLAGQQQFERARAAWNESIRLKPSLAAAHYELAELSRRERDFEAAVTGYRHALRQDPRLVPAYNNLAIVLRDLKRSGEAALCCKRALAIDPACAEAHTNLGLVLQDERRIAEAIACHREAARLRPDSAVVHNALGTALEINGDLEGAAAAYREAIRLQPDFAAAHNNLGSALKQFGQPGEAIDCFEAALRLMVKSSGAHGNMGQTRDELGRFDEAGRGQAELADVRVNRAMTLLLLGQFAEGWREYEWRRRRPSFPANPWPQPFWDGSPLEGRTILLHPEQGLGDILQFIRYAPLVRERGGRVLFACPPKLVPLLGTCPGIDQLCPRDQSLPDFDVQAPLLSLPGIFGTDLTCVPADVPYLSAGKDLVVAWGKRLAGDVPLRVGIGWQGNPAFPDDRLRSIPLAQFAPLAAIDGVRLIGLQKGAGIEQLADAKFTVEDLGRELDERDGAFVDTAAVIANLDLVITSDTALAHLAGALAAKVWVALPLAPDCRWLLDRADSPWYPTMRLFRQPCFGDWPDVFERIAAELALMLPRTRA
jgi:tetratricopeptide (TPR) repeat protein